MPSLKRYEGTWRQYLHVSKKYVMSYPDQTEYEAMSNSFVNPLTACYFLYLAENLHVSTIIQDAACSSIGKMVLKLFQEKGITVINIVRRQEQAAQLEELGANHILNSSSETYKEELEQAIHSLKPTVFFDWIGGKLAREIFMEMPRRSNLFIYGTFDSEDFYFGNKEILGARKTITGLLLSDFIEDILE